MDRNPVVMIEQEDEMSIFFVSLNRAYCSWMLSSNDKDWSIDISHIHNKEES